MKIGILLISNDPTYRGGSNSYLHGLIQGLIKVDKVNDYYLMVYKKNKKYYKSYLSENFHLITYPDENFWLKRLKVLFLLIFIVPPLRRFYLFFESLLYRKLIDSINSADLDIVYSPSASLFPLDIKKKLIISPHDIQFLHYPQYFSLIDRWHRATKVPLSMNLATVIQISSTAMKKDIVKSLGIPSDKIVVISEGVQDAFFDFHSDQKLNTQFLKKYNLEPGYLFYPAQHWPHKNHTTILRAIVYLKEKYGFITKIVFTGKRQKRFQSLYRFVEDNNLTENVRFLEDIKYSELFYAYNNSEIVVIPVEYGPSLPIREAMALGKSVIASKNGVNNEINVNDNIILFSTNNYRELAQKIKLLLTNPRLKKKITSKFLVLLIDLNFLRKYFYDCFYFTICQFRVVSKV
jgi:glycosyltransferase involved in cell wall biosynthesis